ncbi:MAG: IS630 family transposase [Actinomycetia bacterium]|nr:IS630 family transposase [Actinomycetes bacterium]
MSKPVKVRRLTPQEGQQIQRIVRRGGGKSDKSHVKWRRALVVHASAGGNTVPVIAQLAATSEDRVREMIHRFNEQGMRSLDPQWAGGRPRQITTADEAFIVETANARPESLGEPFTRWSIRKLAKFLADNDRRVVKIGRERLRQLLAVHDITFQRTKTWKESNDPDRDAKLDRIEHVLECHADRTFAFDEFGPLAIRPIGGSCWSQAGRPQRQPANYHRLHGVRQFHGCYSVGDDELWGVIRHRKSGVNVLKALKSIRSKRGDGEWIYVILDNLSAHKGRPIREWAQRNNVELCFTPTYSSWANPIEAHFGPLREFVLNNSNHPNHIVLTRRLHEHLRWRNANARAPELLAAQRRERARVRAEKGHRWGRPASQAA